MLEILPKLESDSFDSIITDSPYTAMDEQMQKGVSRKEKPQSGLELQNKGC